jgi:hypothetical protein
VVASSRRKARVSVIDLSVRCGSRCLVTRSSTTSRGDQANHAFAATAPVSAELTAALEAASR